MKLRVYFVVLSLVSSIVLLSCASVPSVSSFKDFNSLNDINLWIHNTIRYDNVYKSIYTVQTPATTLSLRSGCCYDMCQLFAYLAKESGWDVKIVPISTPEGYHTIIDAGSAGYYDPTWGDWFGYNLPKGWSITTWD